MSNIIHNSIHSSDLIATLRFSQQAPMILGRQVTSKTTPLSLTEQSEKHGITEQLFFSCLQTGDDKSALICLDRLTHLFGHSNERIMGLRGLYEEAMAMDNSTLEKCLREYESILSQNPVNLPILKRRIALLRLMSRPAAAITSLIELLEATPTDAEAWCELADLYQSQGMGAQGIFCLEEVLLITPNAWNVHACLAELLYACASLEEPGNSCQFLERSVRHYCRSIELCDGYLRGFYGLALTTSILLGSHYPNNSPQGDLVNKPEFPRKGVLSRLNVFALQKLEDIVRSRSLSDQGQEYSQSELIAAKELLNRLSKVN